MKNEIHLKDIASYSKGKQISGYELIEAGEFNYLNGGINPSGKWCDYNVKGNTVTISEGGNSCGYVNFMNNPFWCGAHCYYLFDVRGGIKYLYYALKSQQERIMKLRSGACMPNIKRGDLGDFRFVYNDNIAEQAKVVESLEKVEAIIEYRKQQLEGLENLIKSRFVEMFGDPISNPFGWRRVQLDDCLDTIDTGKSFICENNARVGSNPAILKLSAVTYGIYRPEENKAIIDTKDFVETAEVHDGDLLFTRKNTPELVGMSAYVKSTPKKLMMPDLIFRLNTRDKCHKVFLCQLINHKLFRGEIRNLASGSAKSMSNISKERLRKIVIALPPIKLQNQFAAFVNQVDKSKVVIQQSLDELQQLFDSLMQTYFK